MRKLITRKQKFMDDFLFIKKSQIPNSGKGVYTKIKIEKEHIITEFSGEKVSYTIGRARVILNQTHSILYLNTKYCLDSVADPNCIATFINDAKGLNKIPYKRNNVLLKLVNGRCFVIAKRNIKAGEELFLWYGSTYWKGLKP